MCVFFFFGTEEDDLAPFWYVNKSSYQLSASVHVFSPAWANLNILNVLNEFMNDSRQDKTYTKRRSKTECLIQMHQRWSDTTSTLPKLGWFQWECICSVTWVNGVHVRLTPNTYPRIAFLAPKTGSGINLFSRSNPSDNESCKIVIKRLVIILEYTSFNEIW